MGWRESFEQALETAGPSKTWLAKRLKIPVTRIYSWGRNQDDRGRPDIEEAIKIAQALRMTLDEVFRGTESVSEFEDTIRAAVLGAYEQGQRDEVQRTSGKAQ